MSPPEFAFLVHQAVDKAPAAAATIVITGASAAAGICDCNADGIGVRGADIAGDS